MPSLLPVLLAVGFTGLAAQVALMRELLALGSGTELALGWMLAAWLLSNAAGSGLAGRLGAGLRQQAQIAAALFTGAAILLPATIFATRAVRAAVQTAPGELLGSHRILAGALLILGPFCVINGWLFAAASRLCRTRRSISAAAATATVYLWEAAGSAAGGLITGFVLVRFFDPFQISFLLGAVNLAVAICLITRPAARRIFLVAVVLLLFGVYLVPRLAPALNRYTLSLIWRPFTIIETANSPYGNLVLLEREGLITLYENGFPLGSAPDPEAAEETVHYALLNHPAPRSLLLIGGGFNGSLVEALKHPTVERVDYVELDPAVIQLTRTYLPGTLPQDPRVRIHLEDGRVFLRNTAVCFDVIVVSLPDPYTAQINRFYTVEFFRLVRRRLAEGGVFSFRLSASENYISPALAAFLGAMRRSLGEVFSDVTLLPGASVHFFASDASGRLARNAQQLIARLQERRLETTYVREYFIPFRMSQDRMQRLEESLNSQGRASLNRDFAPAAYYYGSVLWSSRFSPSSSFWLERLGRVPWGVLMALVAAAGLALALSARSERDLAAVSVALMGLVLICLQMLLLVGFQAIHGSVYHQVAMLTSMFMAGMAVGGWLGLRSSPFRRQARLKQAQAAIAAAPLLLCLFLELAARHPQWPVFGPLALGCGMLGGYQFPVASRAFHKDAQPRGGGLGSLYALDLAGAAAGAAFVSGWLIPVYGFWGAAAAVSLAALFSALALLVRVPRAPAR